MPPKKGKKKSGAGKVAKKEGDEENKEEEVKNLPTFGWINLRVSEIFLILYLLKYLKCCDFR